ncbi:eukaryotic translation initiation factor 5 [Chaetomidium leptoderma]|uniref:Eukaryotic translation initiation factor 5 n=1 Tax=Chaetomidium leptoderma TaxID=669021 RepID=A0AAN7A0N7_9PEZI|nr:eukaryotic translation initiation factor 5 [Chaetomidium leptoderma]
MLSPLLIGLSLVLLTVHTLRQALTSPLNKIPGPWYAKFTSLVLKWHEFRTNRTRYIHDLHLQYGPSVRIAPSEVAFASAAAVKEIYCSGGSGYDKTEFYNLFKVYGRRTMFTTLNKDDHAKRKRILADRYANTNIVRPQSLDGIAERAGNFVNRCFQTNSTIVLGLHSYAFDCVTHHLFHPHATDSLLSSKDEEIMREVTFDDSLQNRLLQFYWPTGHKLFGKILYLFAKPRETPLADGFVLDTCAQTDAAPFTLLNRLQGPDYNLDNLDIAAECLDHMAAGIDTTGDALCFLMWELSQPASIRYQKKLQDELLANPGASFDRLPYLDAIVMEGLRCFPAIPMSLPRYVPPGGRTIDDFFVPGGTTVSCQAYSVQKMDQTVFPDPNTFKPERWLDQPNKGDAERKRLFFAFANGGRGCVGKHLALAEMKMLLQAVYSRFTTLPDATMRPEELEMSDQLISSRPAGQRCLLQTPESSSSSVNARHRLSPGLPYVSASLPQLTLSLASPFKSSPSVCSARPLANRRNVPSVKVTFTLIQQTALKRSTTVNTAIMASLVNVRRDESDPFYRYKMERIQTKIEGKGNGIKTVIINLTSVAQSLARPGSYLIKYFGFELGAQTNLDPADDRWIINGAHEAVKLQELLDGFISKFVLCKKCKNPETDVHIKDGRITLDCKACGQRCDVDLRLKLSGFMLKNVPKKTKLDKAERRAARKAKQNGKGEENGSGGDDNSDMASPNGDDNGIESDDDALTRKIKTEAQILENKAVEIKDDDWAVDMSEEAVKARQQQLPGEFKQKLVLNGEDEDEDVEGGGNTVYDQLGTWIQEQTEQKGGVVNVDDIDIYVKAKELGIESKHRTVLVLVQTIFDENICAQIGKRAPMLKRMITSERHEKAFLGGTERLVGQLSEEGTDMYDKVVKILQLYYHHDLITEELTIKWGSKASKKYVDLATSKKVRKAAEPFIKWLQEAEEESDDDDE